MIQIDTDKSLIHVDDDEGKRTLELGSVEGFELLSKIWLRSGWDTKHVYSFSWLDRPMIQLPEDMIRLQEVIYAQKPDVIIETGIAHGGGLVFYAGLCKIMDKGKVIGVDIEIRPHNREAVEQHPLFPYITMIEGSSVAPEIVAEVKSHIQEGDKVMVILDSNHTRQHVLDELRAYGPLTSVDSFIVATDGIMKDLVDAPRSDPDWAENNPCQAAHEFVAENADFVIEEPKWAFNEGTTRERITYWPDAFIKRVR
jgi:cephalosporin hydroxylase